MDTNKTPKPLNRYEICSVVSCRAQQIADGAPPAFDVRGLTDSFEIAMKEYTLGLTPIIVIQPFPNGTKELVPVFNPHSDTINS